MSTSPSSAFFRHRHEHACRHPDRARGDPLRIGDAATVQPGAADAGLHARARRYYGERFFHGTPFRRAVEEGLLDPARSLLAGMRGSLSGPEDVALQQELGFEVLTGDELCALTPAEYGGRVRERVGDGPLFLSFDIDVLDPAFAPGTGRPGTGGLTTREALGYLRALAGLRFSGYDVVEVSPPYDGPGQPTTVAASNVAYELLTPAATARAG